MSVTRTPPGAVAPPQAPAGTPDLDSPAARRLVIALAALAALAAALVATLLFPHGSPNNDEAVYLLQAHSLAHGHLFTPAGTFAPADQPWFFTLHHGVWVSKYLPVVAGLLALSLLLTGVGWPALALSAALLPVVAYGLGGAVGLTRRHRVWAAAAVSLSPLIVIESGLDLSYVPFAVLAGLALLLAARLTGDRPRGWVAPALGALAVVAGSIRPYDTALLLAPYAFLLVRRLIGRTIRPRTLLAVAGGALGPLALVLGYDAAATGSPLRLPFGQFSPSDAIGFGAHRLYPTDTPHDFEPLQGLVGTLVHFGLQPLTWYAAGLVLLPAGLLTLAVRRWRLGARAPLAAAVGLFLLGYLVFWGPWNASLLWGGPSYLGPFYAIALLLPLAVLAVPVVGHLHRARPRLTAALLVVAVGLNVTQLVLALQVDVRQADRTDQTLALARSVPADRLIEIAYQPAYLGHPVGALGNSDARPLVAAGALDPSQVPAGQPVTLLALAPDLYDPAGAPYALERERRVTGSTLTLQLGATEPAGTVLAVRTPAGERLCAAPSTVTFAPGGPYVECAPGSLPANTTIPTDGPCPTLRCVDVLPFVPVAGKTEPKPEADRRVVVGGDPGGLVAFVDVDVDLPQPFVPVTVAPSPDLSR